MSFFRNIRKSVSQSRSASRENSVTRNNNPSSSRSASVESKKSVKNLKNSNNSKKVSRIDEDLDGVQRSETFTIEDGGNVIVVKPKISTKDKMIDKFNTFTKRRQSPNKHLPATKHSSKQNAQISSTSGYESENYQRYHPQRRTILPLKLNENDETDPFNSLYQPSSVKPDPSPRAEAKRNSALDCATYRKSRIPNFLKDQLEELKYSPESLDEFENDEDKYKTVTLNSFRKSFREKFLTQQKEVPYNPAWFVEVEVPETNTDKDNKDRKLSRSTDLFVYENENYRPESRSPVRDIRDGQSPTRSHTRSPVKRNETFKIERENGEPSIRIEIKNSITPNIPGRFVPVGVAKPMMSTMTTATTTTATTTSGAPQTVTTQTRMSRKSWLTEPHKPKESQNGRYQTRIQITNNRSPETTSTNKILSPASAVAATAGSLPHQQKNMTRIQISGHNVVPNTSGRFFQQQSSPLSSYHLLKTTPEKKTIQFFDRKSAKKFTDNRIVVGGSNGGHENDDNLIESKQWYNQPQMSQFVNHNKSQYRREFTPVRQTFNYQRRSTVKVPWR